MAGVIYIPRARDARAALRGRLPRRALPVPRRAARGTLPLTGLRRPRPAAPEARDRAPHREHAARGEARVRSSRCRHSSREPRIPPEAWLVGVSTEREQALAGALDGGIPRPPRPAPLDALEVVTLDFGAPSVTEDAGVDQDLPDLELDLTYTCESNFYTDVMGSVLGLFIATFVVKPVGTPLVVRLTVPQVGKSFIVSGLVHWVLAFSPSIEAPPGIGLALRPVAGEPRRTIDAFMKLRPPILHDE